MSKRKARRAAGRAREASRAVASDSGSRAGAGPAAGNLHGRSAPARPVIRVTTVVLPIRKLAESLLMREDALRETMRDGRAAWPFSEIWAERYALIGAPAHAGADLGYSVVAVGKGNVRFQRPKRFGASRSGDSEDLISDLTDVREVIVVDLRAFPALRFLPVPAEDLIGAVRAGALTPNGWSGRRFDAWVGGRYEVVSARLPATSMRRVNSPR